MGQTSQVPPCSSAADVALMLRSVLLILSGNAATSGLLFARNIAVASLIPVSDYGVAATFALAMAAVEMASAFGLQQQIVQARDGNDPRLQHALQGFQVLRGAIAAAVLFAVATPLANFLGIPDVAWAYQVLAIVPLCKALENFDIHRFNRDRRFGPMVITSAMPALVSLLVVWPLATWLGDWRVMLGAIVLQAVGTMALSHIVAERPYRLVFDRHLWGRSLRFGWPILLNAVLLFVVFQGDKIIVARLLGMEVFGVFAMAVTLTLTPSMVLAKTVQTSSLPRLSAQVGTSSFPPTSANAIEFSLLLGAALAALGAIAAPLLAAFLQDTGFAMLPALLLPMAILQGLRMTKSGPGVVSLALAFTENAAVSNLPRLAMLVLGGFLLATGAPLLTLIWLGCLGEALGLATALGLLKYRAGTQASIPFPAIALSMTTFAVAAAVAWLDPTGITPFMAAPLLPLAVLAILLARRGQTDQKAP